MKRPYPIYDISTPEAKKASFKSIIPILIDEACDELEQSYEVRPDEVAWIRKVLDYNVTGGKMNRGLMVVESGILLFGGKATNDDCCRFAVLGWVIEMLQAWLLIADDIMDSSVTRRGQPCWYKVDDLGEAAINDAFLVEMLLFKALRRHFRGSARVLSFSRFGHGDDSTDRVGQLLDIKCDTAPSLLLRWIGGRPSSSTRRPFILLPARGDGHACAWSTRRDAIGSRAAIGVAPSRRCR